MKKIILIISLVACNFYYSSAQIIPFPEDSAIWHYLVDDNSVTPPSTSNSNFTIIGDTIINNTSYVLVWNYFDYIFRQDSGKVYIRYLNPSLIGCTDTSEILAYDFNLNLNDSIYIHNCFGDSVLCIVIKSDSVSTNFGYRKLLEFFISSPQLVCYSSVSTMTWIESIGSLEYLFYNLDFYQPGNVCVSRYYFNYLESHHQNTVLFLSNSELKYVDDKIFIDPENTINSTGKMDEVKFYNVYGQLIYTEKPESKKLPIKSELIKEQFSIITILIDDKIYSIKYLKK